MGKKKRNGKVPSGKADRGARSPAISDVLATLEEGDYVRVRPGVLDPDFKDVDIGGWTGRVESILEEGKKRSAKTICIIRWDRRTLSAISSEFRDRCAEAEMGCTEMGLYLSEVERLEPPDAPVPGSLEDLLEQMASDDGYPSPDVLETILARGDQAIEPLREEEGRRGGPGVDRGRPEVDRWCTPGLAGGDDPRPNSLQFPSHCQRRRISTARKRVPRPISRNCERYLRKNH